MEADLFAHDGEFVVLELFEGLFGMDVADYARGVDHARAEEGGVEVVAAVVVVAYLFFVYVDLVNVRWERGGEG